MSEPRLRGLGAPQKGLADYNRNHYPHHHHTPPPPPTLCETLLPLRSTTTKEKAGANLSKALSATQKQSAMCSRHRFRLPQSTHERRDRDTSSAPGACEQARHHFSLTPILNATDPRPRH